MSEFRSGFVALVGRPNVGKSTLVNALVGQKLAIVSPKPQTTRRGLRAIVNSDDAQVVLVDTPGLVEGGDALRRSLRRVTGMAAAEADLGLALFELHRGAAHLEPADREVLQLAARGTMVVAINKVDLLARKEELLPWMALFAEASKGAPVVPISAKTGDGLEALLRELKGRLPVGPPLFPPDMITDEAERVLVAELVREQLLAKTHDEVPHSTAVEIEEFVDGRGSGADPICHLTGRIVVERDSQKGIVVGKKGQMIKSISTAARRQIELLLGARVYLRLTVHVDKDWRTNARAVSRLGYGGSDS
ncbi:MAG: GTPase Era [Deltaproteobacteria bacterium]|nr:GTPase Era [Deltaproteobacteria bacterium]